MAPNSTATCGARRGYGTTLAQSEPAGRRTVALFRDRRDGGQRLAEHLLAYGGHQDVLIPALPRRGVADRYRHVLRVRGAAVPEAVTYWRAIT